MNTQVPDRRFWRITLVSLIGPLVWASHLGFIYVAQHVMCARGFSGTRIFWTLLAGTLPLLLVLAPFALAPRQWFGRAAARPESGDTDGFLVETMWLLVVLSLAGIVWTVTGVLMLPECAAAQATLV
jgi:hypothetical protein